MWANKSLPLTQTAQSFPIGSRRVGLNKKRAILLHAVLFVILAGVFLELARLELDVWLILVTLFLGGALVLNAGITNRKAATTILLCFATALSAINYLTWRVGVINWFGWWMALPLFIAELFGILHTLGFQYTVWPRPNPVIQAVESPTRRPIYVFIPTVNEGNSVLEPTLRGVLQARQCYLESFPHGQITIVVCNDGRVAGVPNWRDAERLAEHLGVMCITRTVKGGAKAGNIENARQLVGAKGDALVVIFDADQIAKPDFFLKTIPPFADPTIAWVQTGQYYSNLENIVAHWAHDQQALFYGVLCPGKAAQNAAFICGTNVVLSAAALDEIGGLPQDSVTEDFAASIQLHPRWRSIFLSDVLATGLGPMTLKSYFKQQNRWAIGTLSVFRAHWRDILLPKRDGLHFEQRIQYALACTHYLSGLRDAIYVVIPLCFLLTGIPAVRGADLASFLAHFLPYFLLSQAAFWFAGWRKTSWRGVVIGFGSFPVLLNSIFTVVFGRRVGFVVTSKQRAAESTWQPLIPHLVAALMCITGLFLFIRNGSNQAPTLITALWVVYTLIMLSAMLWIGVVDSIGQKLNRPVLNARNNLESVFQRPPVARVRGLAAIPALSLVFVFAMGCVLGTSRIVTIPPPEHFAPILTGQAPLLGVSLPSALAATPVSQLDSKLGVSLAIVGRTQDISDRFDSVWANQLAADHARPWLTLLFDVPGASKDSASLPAIANGVHDDALRQWADSIRTYGKPVYLTILPHVDRNWVLSSAVANNGIPEDAPRAWQHVRAVFAQENAVNVAWVWAPADPAHDQLYAPPSSTIDIVALSLLSYPDTMWADPSASLAEVTARYPHTPLFFQVSAEGQPQQKAAWLRQVGAAVANTPNVYTVLYYDGDPSPDALTAQHGLWAVDSDPLSLDALHKIVQQDKIGPLSS